MLNYTLSKHNIPNLGFNNLKQCSINLNLGLNNLKQCQIRFNLSLNILYLGLNILKKC